MISFYYWRRGTPSSMEIRNVGRIGENIIIILIILICK
jgi:hypothetical protein